MPWIPPACPPKTCRIPSRPSVASDSRDLGGETCSGEGSRGVHNCIGLVAVHIGFASHPFLALRTIYLLLFFVGCLVAISLIFISLTSLGSVLRQASGECNSVLIPFHRPGQPRTLFFLRSTSFLFFQHSIMRVWHNDFYLPYLLGLVPSSFLLAFVVFDRLIPATFVPDLFGSLVLT